MRSILDGNRGGREEAEGGGVYLREEARSGGNYHSFILCLGGCLWENDPGGSFLEGDGDGRC